MADTTTTSDGRVRRRITTAYTGPGNLGVSAVGTYSAMNDNIQWCDRHFISILQAGAVTGGIISVRGRPIGTSAFSKALPSLTAVSTPIGIEAIPLASAKTQVFEVNGFFEGFELTISTAVSGVGGPKIAMIVNSLPSTP